MTSSSDGSVQARALYPLLVDPAGGDASARALAEEARALDRLGRRAEARTLFERALHSLDASSASTASALLRWIARSHEVDADYHAAADCAEAAVAMAEASADRSECGRSRRSNHIWRFTVFAKAHLFVSDNGLEIQNRSERTRRRW